MGFGGDQDGDATNGAIVADSGSGRRATSGGPATTAGDGQRPHAPIRISHAAGQFGRPEDAPTCAVDLSSLATLRGAVTEHGRDFGLVGEPLQDLVLVANELATNVVRHGGGTGQLWLWRSDGCVYCQVSDTGPGLRDGAHAGDKPTDANALTGRGLWLIRQMSAAVHLDTGAHGTTVTVTLPVG
jgi:anti-sigma regulatory factor (Ser/Thr protein kinase)